MLSIILFIVVIGILIFVHELGHFLAAKRAGIRVDEFALGFPPRIFSVKRGETTYALNLIPFGGYVKIFGEDGGSRDLADSFAGKSKIIRAGVIAAGVLMNWVFAALLISIVAFLGLPQVVDETTTGNVVDRKVQITLVAPESPARQAGIEPGDSVRSLAAGGERVDVKTVEDVQYFVSQNLDRGVTVELERGSMVITKTVQPRMNPPEGEGALGVALAEVGRVRYHWYQAPYEGVKRTVELTRAFIAGFVDIIRTLVMEQRVIADVTGPVGIAALTGQFSNLGFVYLLQFIAVLSLNLAIINLLPLPALDGGRLLFLGIESLKGSPVNERIERTVHAVGLALLLLLMVLITVQDVKKFFF